MPRIHIYRHRFDKEKSHLINNSLEETVTYLIRNICWTLKEINGMLSVTSDKQYIEPGTDEFHLGSLDKVERKLNQFWPEVLGVWYAFEDTTKIMFISEHTLLVLTGKGDELKVHTFSEED